MVLFRYATLIVNKTLPDGDNITIQFDVVIFRNRSISDNTCIVELKIFQGVSIIDGVTIGCNAVIKKHIDEVGLRYVGIIARKLR